MKASMNKNQLLKLWPFGFSASAMLSLAMVQSAAALNHISQHLGQSILQLSVAFFVTCAGVLLLASGLVRMLTPPATNQ
jgi:CHASE2 domain-containing sensor protein